MSISNTKNNPWDDDELYKGCTFPDCGCVGARNCMSGEPNTGSYVLNIEKRGNNVNK